MYIYIYISTVCTSYLDHQIHKHSINKAFWTTNQHVWEKRKNDERALRLCCWLDDLEQRSLTQNETSQKNPPPKKNSLEMCQTSLESHSFTVPNFETHQFWVWEWAHQIHPADSGDEQITWSFLPSEKNLQNEGAHRLFAKHNIYRIYAILWANVFKQRRKNGAEQIRPLTSLIIFASVEEPCSFFGGYIGYGNHHGIEPVLAQRNSESLWKNDIPKEKELGNLLSIQNYPMLS